MARKKGKAHLMKRKKAEPAVETLTLRVPPGTSYCDLSQICSLANRRFYRQGLVWAVESFKVFKSSSATSPQNFTISKLPSTWVMSNSWHKGFAAWQRMNREALLESESVRPRFLDFKIYMDAEQHQLGFAANLLPAANGSIPGKLATAGEWESSKFVIPRTDGTDTALSREIVAVGQNYPGASAATGLDAVSLIEGYAASRALPDILDPNVPDDAALVSGNIPENWLGAIDNDGTRQDEAVIDDMITENNLAPYPFENDGVRTDTMYPGGANQLEGLQFHDSTFFNPGTFANVVGLKGGTFPCGLIKFSNGSAEDVDMLLRLIPGPHRGYLCGKMQDM